MKYKFPLEMYLRSILQNELPVNEPLSIGLSTEPNVKVCVCACREKERERERERLQKAVLHTHFKFVG